MGRWKAHRGFVAAFIHPDYWILSQIVAAGNPDGDEVQSAAFLFTIISYTRWTYSYNGGIIYKKGARVYEIREEDLWIYHEGFIQDRVQFPCHADFQPDRPFGADTRRYNGRMDDDEYI